VSHATLSTAGILACPNSGRLATHCHAITRPEQCSTCLLTRGDLVTSLVPDDRLGRRALSFEQEAGCADMIDPDVDARSAAFSSLLAAVAGSRRDLASARFDEELAAAEAGGSIDPVVARTLRWWQREALRSVEEHLQSVLPALLAGLETADRDAADSVAASAQSWAAATGGATARATAPRPPDDPEPIRSVPEPPHGPGGGAGTSPGDPTTPYLRPVDRAPDLSGPVDGAPGPATRLLRPGFAPPEPPTVTPPGDPVAHGSPEGGAPARRLLVGGLTVLADGVGEGRAEHDRPSTPRDDVPGTPR
jgi:hypothetical protein